MGLKSLALEGGLAEMEDVRPLPLGDDPTQPLLHQSPDGSPLP